MAQEVQTTLNYQAELNLIEWVWHQENKVREHTQVEQAFWYEAKTSSSVILNASQSEPQTPTIKATMTSITQSGATEFKIVDGNLRVPLAGAYLAHIQVRGGSSSMTVTNYLKVNGETVYEKATTNATSRVETDMVLNLGRYDQIEHWGKMYFSGTWYAGTSSDLSITLKKL